MTTKQKIKYIVGIVLAIVTGILIPIYLKNRPDKKVIKIDGGIMIEQRAILPYGGGSPSNIIIDKSFRIRRDTNE